MATEAMIIVLLMVFVTIDADVYMHNPPGGNNRLNGQNRNRQNNNRMFDSQNNNRGGYNVGESGRTEGAGTLTYIGGSKLSLQWTNQHECGGAKNPGGENTGCDIIIQYMCSDKLRDGTSTQKPRTGRDSTRTGLHEDQQYYADCKNRARDTNLYHADQKLKRGDARSTRQNPNGCRSGLECPEERDYYPYHAPSPWKDVAILTSNPNKCNQFVAQSQNVIGKGYCKKATGLQPITEQECKNKGGTWNIADSHGIDRPECKSAPVSRDNHLGNTDYSEKEGIPKTLAYEWNVPNINAQGCVLRIRYNMSVGDYEPFGVDKSNDNSRGNKGTPNLDIGKDYGLSATEAKDRGYFIENNPEIEPLKSVSNLEFRLAINTAQTGRTFEDRSHKFKITQKSNVAAVAGKTVHNLNVMGKRGNIVQVYPAVEYDFEPGVLKVKRGDIIHPQWTGSLRNPRNNDGEGARGEDKSNMIQMGTPKGSAFGRPKIGQPANSYPLSIDSARFLNVDKNMAQKLAFPKRSNNVKLPIGRTTVTTGSRTTGGGGTTGGGAPALIPSKANDNCFRPCITQYRAKQSACAFCGAGGHCCSSRWGTCTPDQKKIVPRWPFRCVTAGSKKDEPERNDDNTEKTTPLDPEWSFSAAQMNTFLNAKPAWDDDLEEECDEGPECGCNVTSNTTTTTTTPAPATKPKKTGFGTFYFSEIVHDVEEELEQSDEAIRDILNDFDNEVTMEREKRGRGGRDAAKLDNAPAYVNVGPVTATTSGEYDYVCTRNNNFSNRSQKGKIIVS